MHSSENFKKPASLCLLLSLFVCMCLYVCVGDMPEWSLWYDSVLLRWCAWPGLPTVDLPLFTCRVCSGSSGM